jgi:cobalt-zinc-cadmium efflux system outer membrane protein
VELSLRQRLSQTYTRYRTALAVVEEYRKYAIPEAREAYELYLDSFNKRRAAYPQVLIAQRNYFQISVTYIDALEQLRRAEVAVQGLLLVDGLEEPPGPPSEGGRFQPRESGRSEDQFRQDPLGEGGRGLDELLGQRPQ